MHRIEEPQWENYDRVVIVLLFAMVTTTLRSRNLSKNIDATEFDAERLLFRKPGGAQTEKRTPQTNSYARKFLMNSQGVPIAARSLPGRCVTHVIAGRPFYDQADYEDVRR